MIAEGVPFQLVESAKPRLRAAGLELAVRVLRAAKMIEAADWLSHARPDAISEVGSAMRDVSEIAADREVIARSVRRSSLRYAARKFRASGVHEGAAAFLDRTASAIEIGQDLPSRPPRTRGGLYRSSRPPAPRFARERPRARR